MCFGQRYHGHMVLKQLKLMDTTELPIPAHYQFPEASYPARRIYRGKSYACLLQHVKLIDYSDLSKCFFSLRCLLLALPPFFPQHFSHKNWAPASTQLPNILISYPSLILYSECQTLSISPETLSSAININRPLPGIKTVTASCSYRKAKEFNSSAAIKGPCT